MSFMSVLRKRAQTQRLGSRGSWSSVLVTMVSDQECFGAACRSPRDWSNREDGFFLKKRKSTTGRLVRPCAFCSLSSELYVVDNLFFRVPSSGCGHHLGEGVQGFAQAALAGGIPCLVAAKWNIPAKESIILLTRMYAFMAANKVWNLVRHID